MRKYHSPKEYQDAAKSPDAPADELRILSQSQYDFVRLAVAQNPNATADVLASLVPVTLNCWNVQALAAALAENPKTPAESLSLLAERLIPVLDHGRGNEMGFAAGLNLCSNPNTPLAAVREMLGSAKVAVLFRKAVAKQARRADVVNLLLADRSSVVQQRAQARLKSVGGDVADL